MVLEGDATARSGPLARRWATVPRARRFVIVGGVNTVFGYCAYAAFLRFGLHYVAAAFLGTIVGVMFNYFTTGGLVFQHLSRAALLRFVLTYGVIYLVNIAGLAILGRYGIDAYVGGLVLILPMAAFAYLLMERFVFRRVHAAH